MADGVVPRRLITWLRALPAGRGRHPSAERRARPRGGHRPRARRAGRVPGAGGQPAHAVGHLLRDGEPPHHGPRLARPVRPAAGAAPSTRLLVAPAARLRPPPVPTTRPWSCSRPASTTRPTSSIAPGPPDGRRAGRGSRPLLPRQPRLDAHHRGRAAGRRDLPADRRRLPRPAAVPLGLGARRRRLLNAARAGNVIIVQRVGNGVADDKLVYTYVPNMVEYYLGEKPILPTSTPSAWLDDQREPCSTGSTELVCQAGRRLRRLRHRVRPPRLRRGAGHDREAIRDDPRGWIAQEVVQLSTSRPRSATSLAPRHVDLRPFAVNDGDDVWVLPGGLTRVALPEGQPGRQLQPGRRVEGHLGAGPPVASPSR